VAWYIDNGRVTIYCPDSIDLESFYNKSTRHESYRFSEILNPTAVKHWLDDGKCRGHDWNYWQDMLPYYLSLLV
jgi:esterase/lipase superfamily enzyme